MVKICPNAEERLIGALVTVHINEQMARAYWRHNAGDWRGVQVGG